MQHHQEEQTVTRIKSELDQIILKNAVDFKRLNEILESLRSIQMDLRILKKTKIGVTVNNVRKTFKNSKDVAKITAELIRSWKKVAKDEFGTKLSESNNSDPSFSPTGNGNGNSGLSVGADFSFSPPSNSSDKNSCSSDDPQQQAAKDAAAGVPAKRIRKSSDAEEDEEDSVILVRRNRNKQSSGSGGNSSFSSSDQKSAVPPNETRAKSVKLIEEALQFESEKLNLPEEKIGDPRDLAVEIEEAIFGEVRETDRKYKSRIRSRVVNLRDANNPGLRAKVLLGQVSPRKVAGMTAEEMANEEMKKFRHSVSVEMLKEHEMPEVPGGSVHSDMFLCQQCKERDTNYTISQERQEGEYEPVSVTLIACNKCGCRWKSY